MTPLPDDLSEEEKRGFDPRGKAYGVIYRAMCRINGKVYIGQTIVSMAARKAEHLSSSKTKDSYFAHAITHYGRDAFDWEVIDEAYSKKELDDQEIYWIRFYSSNDTQHGYNLQRGGNVKGKVTESTKSRISKVWKDKYLNGYVHPMTGKNASRETRERISQTRKKLFEAKEITNPQLGKPLRPSTKEKLRNSAAERKAKHDTGAVKRRNSIATEIKPGQHLSKSTQFPSVRIQCVDTGVIYESMNQAGRELDITHTTFSLYFSGSVKSVAGCQWIKLPK